MKSSVRILAIALALAFLLLARTAFQEDTTASAAAIELKDGEASFADLLDGTMEAEYIGFRGKATTSVYFYIESGALGTKVTARAIHMGPDGIPSGNTGEDTTLFGATQSYTLRGGNTAPAAVDQIGTTTPVVLADVDLTMDSATTTVAEGLDTIYCGTSAAIEDYVVVYAGGDAFTKPDNEETTIKVEGWGVATTTITGVAGACPANNERDEDDRTAILESKRNELAMAALEAIRMLNADEVQAAKDDNALLYEYKSGNKYVAATSTNPKRRYTNQVVVGSGDPAATRDTVGSDSENDIHKPLDTVVFKVVDVDTAETDAEDDKVTEVPTFPGDRAGGQFRLAYLLSAVDALADPPYDRRDFVVDATYNIVDVYEHDQNEKRASDDYAKYTSGFKRAYVSSGSDAGRWVTIREVADEKVNAGGVAIKGDDSPTSNLFQGMVEITSDATLNNEARIYAQDGDTLTLQVFEDNDDRSSDVLASATAMIDGSEPTISELSPADESITSDNTLRVSFDVNDEGAGLDFRKIGNVVKKIEVQARAESLDTTHKGTGMTCRLDDPDADDGRGEITNAGGNAGRLGILLSPPGDVKFTDRCAAKYDDDGKLMDGTVVDTTSSSDNSHGVKFNLIITSQDLAGNVDTHTTQLTIDAVKPRLATNPTVGQAWDADKNEAKSSANSILVQFDESLDVDTVAAADFVVTGYTIDSVEVVGTNEDEGEKRLNEYVVLTLTEDLANNARPRVTVSGVSDEAGNTIAEFTSESDNKIKAAVTVVPFSALLAKKGEQAISFTADEALFAKSGSGTDTKETKASVNGKTLAVKVAADTLGGSATFKQNTYRSDGSRAFGVMIRAADANGNATDKGAVTVDDEDLKLELDNDVSANSMFYVKLANWPPADSDLNGKFQGEVKAYVNDAEVASSTEMVGWGTANQGKVQLKAGVLIKKDATLTLKYKYVTADQVIQVDVDEPTMISTPADNDETDYAAGVIQFKWTEDKEYAGDTYEKVTLNEASYEGPNGTSTDILDMLTTNDNKTWVFRPAADLALGAHEFTLKATDAAGNSNEVSVTITVIERKPVKINLGPGWNLISLPGMPASADVNDVFSSDTVSVISQYDGRRVSPWTVWTRGSDGSLSSSPAGRTTIDSGLGLWVLSSDGSALEVDIPGTSKDAPAEVPPSIDLIAGWNLVAVILIGDTDEVGVNEYLPEGAWTRAFRLSNATGQFESFTPATRDSEGKLAAGEPLKAGDALWVYATKATVIVPK